MKKNQSLYQLFLDELEDMLSAENQILEALPKMIKQASAQDLKDALSDHMKETEGQVERLNKVFLLLNVTPKEKHCEGMEGILAEGEEMFAKKVKSATTDAAIISAGQKVEHYEIASYGAMRSFAKHLELDSEIADLLKANLDEEAHADKLLTKIACGTMFTSGINDQAAEADAEPPRGKAKR